MRLAFLVATCALLLFTAPLGSDAQTHDAHPPAGAPAPSNDHSEASGSGGAAPHEGMQHGGGGSFAEMMWSMYTDLGNIAYQNGLYDEAEKTNKSALKEARSFPPTDRRLGIS